jgi:hypothetical protein
MYHLITYKDFHGRVHKRSLAMRSCQAQTRVKERADCAAIVQIERITEAEHARNVAKQRDIKRFIRNNKSSNP